jgi:isopentenyl-diphosphate Delta-isomerase
MPDELIDIYTEDNKPTGKTMMKSLAHRKHLWHRTTHIWVYNSKGEILLQRRAASKIVFPNILDVSAAGHIAAGEDEITGAERELAEEVGIEVDKEKLEFIKTIASTIKINKEITENEFHYIYLYSFEGAITEMNIQIEELSEVMWKPLDVFEKEITETPEDYAPHTEEYYRIILNKIKEKLEK